MIKQTHTLLAAMTLFLGAGMLPAHAPTAPGQGKHEANLKAHHDE